MAKCPSCSKHLRFASVVGDNVENYGRQVTATSECCGSPFRVGRLSSFSVSPVFNTDIKEDDWGEKIKKYHSLSESSDIIILRSLG